MRARGNACATAVDTRAALCVPGQPLCLSAERLALSEARASQRERLRARAEVGDALRRCFHSGRSPWCLHAVVLAFRSCAKTERSCACSRPVHPYDGGRLSTGPRRERDRVEVASVLCPRPQKATAAEGHGRRRPRPQKAPAAEGHGRRRIDISLYLEVAQ